MKRTLKIAGLMCLVLLMSILMLTACNDPATSNGGQTTPTAEEQETPTEEETTPTVTEHFHVFGEWIMTKEPDCETVGVMKRYCIECLFEESQPIAPLGHVEVITDEARAPTCTTEGNTVEKYCSKCNKLLAVRLIIPVTVHDPVNGICTMCNGDVYDVTIWIADACDSADQVDRQIDAFEAAHPGIIIDATIQSIAAADAGHRICANVANAPDIYCFSQDQLARLVQAQVLAAPTSTVANAIKANNDTGSVAAATYNGTVYAYPMTSDNGYFMYYDTSIISPEDAESLEALIAACEKNNKKFRFALDNAWYVSSFFFATGCYSNWTTNAEGDFIGFDDTFNSANGLIAMKGMQKLVQSSCHDSNADIFTNAAVIVSGVWNLQYAQQHFGENLGVTDLPSFTVDGTSYHLGSYSGHKLMGVKPTTDAKKATVLSLLAEYLTNEECQLQRAQSFEWCPSNLKAQQSEFVQGNAAFAALAKQSAYAVPQGNMLGSWWDIAKVLGGEAKAATSEDALKKALLTYETTIKAALEKTIYPNNNWSIIGNICNTNWDTDLPLTKVSEGVWESEVLALEAGKEFKVRQGASWDVNFGVDGAPNGGNIVVKKTGNYKVRFTYDGTTANVEFIPVN